MNILSLFDGMSCGQQALVRAGINYDKYYASEIDKYAIKVTMANFPNTIQLGSVTNVNGYDLPKIDLLMGGSPCQSFSFAGKRKGMSTKDSIEILTLEHYLELKEQQYEFEGQSYLFWEYMRLLNEIRVKNPDVYFLLENVEMGEKWEKVLSKAIGVKGIHINSALVSAQNRKRIYWTNIGLKPAGLFGDMESIIEMPKDKGILLKDILEENVDKKYYLSDKMLSYLNENSKIQKEKGNGFNYSPTEGDSKGKAVTTKEGSRMDDNFIIVHNMMPRTPGNPNRKTKGGTGHLTRSDGKTYCLDTGNTNAVEIYAMRGREDENGKLNQKLEERKDGKTNCLTSVPKDNLIRQLNPSKESGGNQPYQQNRVYDIDGISPALCANKSDLIIGKKIKKKGNFYNQTTRWGIFDADGISPTITASMGMGGGHVPMVEDEIKAGDFRYDEGFRWRENGKSPSLMARAREDLSGPPLLSNISNIRRLTPVECERLQTVDDNYTNHVSDSQRYKMLGNGWTIDVISYIFSYLNK